MVGSSKFLQDGRLMQDLVRSNKILQDLARFEPLIMYSMNDLDLLTFLKGSLFLDRFMTVRFRNSITNVHVPRLKNKHSAAFVFGRAMVKNPHKQIHEEAMRY